MVGRANLPRDARYGDAPLRRLVEGSVIGAFASVPAARSGRIDKSAQAFLFKLTSEYAFGKWGSADVTQANK